MAPNAHNDINLLPRELKRKHKKAAATERLPDYTVPENRSEKKGKSIFSRVFSIFKRADAKDKKEVKPEIKKLQDLPKGKLLPSAMFLEADKQEKVEKPVIKVSNAHGIQAGNIMSMHTPDFIERKEPVKPIVPIVEPVAPVVSVVEPIEPVKKDEKEKPKKLSYTDSIKTVRAESKKEETQAPVHRASSFDVNLLSEEYSRSFRKTRPVFTLLSFLGAAFAVIVLIFGALNIYNQKSENRIKNIETISQALKETIATYKSIDQEDSKLRKKIDVVEELLENHISWYSFLDKLEDETIPEVTYLSIAASSEGIMVITALAKDYTSLARQMTVFSRTEWIESLDITSASLVEETATLPSGVSFDMQTIINKQVLYSAQ
ncbi:hypothetical protein KKF64_02530 [Patescibacteria group bacterium]|nr:hypothetical protein [Patescibacteria group bacterium]